jgi:hypothetical protein
MTARTRAASRSSPWTSSQSSWCGGSGPSSPALHHLAAPGWVHPRRPPRPAPPSLRLRARGASASRLALAAAALAGCLALSGLFVASVARPAEAGPTLVAARGR